MIRNEHGYESYCHTCLYYIQIVYTDAFIRDILFFFILNKMKIIKYVIKCYLHRTQVTTLFYSEIQIKIFSGEKVFDIINTLVPWMLDIKHVTSILIFHHFNLGLFCIRNCHFGIYNTLLLSNDE